MAETIVKYLLQEYTSRQDDICGLICPVVNWSGSLLLARSTYLQATYWLLSRIYYMHLYLIVMTLKYYRTRTWSIIEQALSSIITSRPSLHNADVCSSNFYLSAEEVLNGVAWSEKLDEDFQLNYEKDPTLTWQYFGSASGFFRNYPGKLNVKVIMSLNMFRVIENIRVFHLFRIKTIILKKE